MRQRTGGSDGCMHAPPERVKALDALERHF